MKFVILCKAKSKVKLIEKCKGEDLAVMGIAILEEAINRFTEEKKVSRKEIIRIVKELLEENLI